MKEEGRTIGELLKPRREKALPALFPDLSYIGLEHVEAQTMRLLGSVPSHTMRSQANRFCKGDVLYSRLRPYLNKVWRADRDGLCSAEFIVLPGNENIDANFLRYRLNARDFVQFANSLNAGDRPRVDFDQISSFFLPNFSLPHQHRIVAKIEELFSELDKGIENLKQAKAQLAVYRQALLKHAFEGKLTADWRAAHANQLESGDTLLAQLLAERRKKWTGRGRYAEPEPPNTDEVGELPENWVWASPEQLSSFENYSLAIGPFGSNLKVSDYKESGVPLVFVRNIRACRFAGERTIYVAQEKADELRAHSVSGGDILITKMGEPPGDAAIYPVSQPDAVITADCIKLRLSSLLPRARYFLHAINSGVFRRQIMKISSGVAQQKVSLGRFRMLALPLPPLAEQEQIVCELDSQISAIDALEADIDLNLQKAEALRQSILKKAFAGELVPQDPKEEPAAELLKRIRAECAEALTPKPKRTRATPLTEKKKTGRLVL